MDREIAPFEQDMRDQVDMRHAIWREHLDTQPVLMAYAMWDQVCAHKVHQLTRQFHAQYGPEGVRMFWQALFSAATVSAVANAGADEAPAILGFIADHIPGLHRSKLDGKAGLRARRAAAKRKWRAKKAKQQSEQGAAS